MHVRRLNLINFRNYRSCTVEFAPERNIIIGDNAQGKTNLLEAIEILSSGRSARAERDVELVLQGESICSFEVIYTGGTYDESIAFELSASPSGKSGECKFKKTVKINGVVQSSLRGLPGRLPLVSFKSADLNLLRGGPKFRRDWLDHLALRMRPAFHDTLSNYAKVAAQRNRLLKNIFEQGKITVSDQDQLLVWDKQLARFGTLVIKERLKVLEQLLPVCREYQTHLSSAHERLSINYLFTAGDAELDDNPEPAACIRPAGELARMEDVELARLLLRLMKERRSEEIRRKSSLIGPHRDDLVFRLNDFDAVSFASQGQQRSIVLSLKLSELKLICAQISDNPVLLLDDVLAELDSTRQALLMAAINDKMQTIVTTTGLSAFGPEWVSGARVLQVKAGSLRQAEPAPTAELDRSVIIPDLQGVN